MPGCFYDMIDISMQKHLGEGMYDFFLVRGFAVVEACGTLPYEVATTGVKGLKTIIPVAGISNWYDYTNSQGVSRTSEPHYTDHLSALNAGSLFLDDNWTVPNEEYGAYLKQLTKDERAANGNYEGMWTPNTPPHIRSTSRRERRSTAYPKCM